MFRIFSAILLAFLIVVFPAYTQSNTNTADAADIEIPSELLLPIAKPWTGDFNGMLQRRQIRILVPHSRTYYYIDGAKEQGLSYEIGKEFEKWVNQEYKQPATVYVVFIPVARDKMFEYLKQGIGDLALGGITVTPERDREFAHSIAVASKINEVIITNKDNQDGLQSLDALAGKTLHLQADSSYLEHLNQLNTERFKDNPVKVELLDASLSEEDILEMLNSNIFQYTITNEYLANTWSKAFDNLVIKKNLIISEGNQQAWYFRQNSPELQAASDAYLKTHKQGTLFGNIVINRYLKSDKLVKNINTEEEHKKFLQYTDYFKQYADEYDFDYLMMVAQGYQESGLNQLARSHRGAVGVMQLLPSTAADPNVNISGIEDNAENNIHAGIRYMAFLRKQYLNGPELDELNRTLMSFAAYNAGPGNLRKFRRHAEQSGLDPNRWFNNVEISASRIIGQETVQYVSNIFKYYIAYKTILERQMQENNQ